MVLAKTVKGWCLGSEIEGRNATHQVKKMTPAQLGSLRQRLGIPGESPAPTYYRPPEGSAEHDYLVAARRRLGGSLPRRRVRAQPLGQPDPAVFEEFRGGSGNRAVSTTMGFTALLRGLMRDAAIGSRIVPIIPDEGRTFGMEALYAAAKIYAPTGQRYDPVDSGLPLCYRESVQGQILGRAHGALLRLLLDVRLPARGRRHLGGRRHAGPRLPAGSDGRAHHAARRGAAAPAT